MAARAVLMRLFCRFDRITKVFVDGGYTGKLIGWANEMFGYDVEVVKRNELHKFQVLPKRWIVERTSASSAKKTCPSSVAFSAIPFLNSTASLIQRRRSIS